MVVMSFMYISVVMKAMKSEFRSFLPTFEKETELQADQDNLSWFSCTGFAQRSFKATGVGTEAQPLCFPGVCLYQLFREIAPGSCSSLHAFAVNTHYSHQFIFLNTFELMSCRTHEFRFLMTQGCFIKQTTAVAEGAVVNYWAGITPTHAVQEVVAQEQPIFMVKQSWPSPQFDYLEAEEAWLELSSSAHSLLPAEVLSMIRQRTCFLDNALGSSGPVTLELHL